MTLDKLEGLVVAPGCHDVIFELCYLRVSTVARRTHADLDEAALVSVAAQLGQGSLR